MPSLLVIGSINYDLILTHSRLPEAGETVVGATLFETPGGKGANQAIAAARASRILGLDLVVRFIGGVGRDSFGELQLRQLSADGIDVSGVRTFERPTGVSTIWVDSGDGENRILNAPGANRELKPEHLRPDDFDSCDLLLLQNEIAPETLAKAAALATTAGVRVIWDPAPFTMGGTPPIAPASIEWVTPNETEAAALLGRKLDPEPWRDAIRLRDLGYRRVLLTLGHRGVISAEGLGPPTEVRAPRVHAIDSTGAGDAFCGAFAAATLSGRSHDESLSFAIRFASGSVTRRGAQVSFPRDPSELAERPS